MLRSESKIKRIVKSRRSLRGTRPSNISPSILLDSILATSILAGFFAYIDIKGLYIQYIYRAKLADPLIAGSAIKMEVDDYLAQKNQWPSQKYIQKIFNKKSQQWEYIQRVEVEEGAFTLILEEGLFGQEEPRLTYHSTPGTDPTYMSVTWHCGYAGPANSDLNRTNIEINIEGCNR